MLSRRIRTEHGFSLPELLVAAGVTSAVTGVVFAAVVPAHHTYVRQQEAVDLQQRLRVATQTLAGAIRNAALVLPYQVGDRGDDPSAGVFHRRGVISILAGSAPAYAAGAPADPTSTFYLDDDDDGLQRLMRYDGRDTTMPVVDNVIGLTFELLGEPEPPRPAPPSGVEPRMVYGPQPPPPGVDDPADEWPPGENCVVLIADGAQQARLPNLGGTDFVTLAPAMLTDGPWCPDARHPRRLDADLLRVRLVRVTLRLQAPAAFRGSAGPLFLNAGTALPARHVPDESLVFDVAPRGLLHDR